MKKSLGIGLVIATAIFLTGCGNKFEPTESTIYITSDGEVKSAIMESFDKAYYDFEELSADVEKKIIQRLMMCFCFAELMRMQ